MRPAPSTTQGHFPSAATESRGCHPRVVLFLLPLALAAVGCVAPTEPWRGAGFEVKAWEESIRLWSLSLTFVAAGVAALFWVAHASRVKELVSWRWARHWGVRLGAGVFALPVLVGIYLTHYSFLNPNVRYAHYYHRHDFFQNYVGAKYLPELGHQAFYPCVVVAEREAATRSPGEKAVPNPNRTIRDVATGKLEPLNHFPELADDQLCRQRFSAARWEAFVRDVDFFRVNAPRAYWEGMAKDSGHRRTAVWRLSAYPWLHFTMASRETLRALASLDVLLSVGSLALLWWAFGLRVATLGVVCWSCNAVATAYWSMGAFLHGLDGFAITLAVCLARRQRPLLAGAAFGWALLLRPQFLVLLPPLGFAFALYGLLRRRRTPRAWRRFFGAAVVSTAVLLPAGMVVDGGVDLHPRPHAYLTQIHTNQVGLAVLMAHAPATRMERVRDNSLADPFAPWREARLARQISLLPAQLAAGMLVLLGLGWVAYRTRQLWSLLVAGLPLFVLVFAPNCQDWSFFFVLAAAACHRRGAYAAVALVLVGATQLAWPIYFIDDRYAAMSWAVVGIALALLLSLALGPWWRVAYRWFASPLGRP